MKILMPNANIGSQFKIATTMDRFEKEKTKGCLG